MSTPTRAPDELSSAWRTIAPACWRHPVDPTVTGLMAVDLTDVEARLAALREATGVRVTLTHVVAWVVGRLLAEIPQANARVRWGRVVPRASVDVFLQVALEDGGLSGLTLRGADQLSLVEVAEAVSRKSERVRGGDDPLAGSVGLLRRLPVPLRRLAMWFAAMVGGDLRWHLPRLGMPRDPFGGAMVTSLGMHGVDVGWAPLFPTSRCPFILLVGAVDLRPWVVDGQLAVRRVGHLCATFDHRVFDGVLTGKLATRLRELLAGVGDGTLLLEAEDGLRRLARDDRRTGE